MSQKTEKEIILAHTLQWFQHSEWSMERFAHELLAPALEAAGLVEGLVIASDGDTYIKARKAWRQRVDRIFNASQPFPLEWKWPWINSVSEPFRSEMLKDLQLFAGMIPVIRPELRPVNGVQSSRARIAEVMIECAEFFQAAANPAQDGRYDRDDHADASEMVEKGFDAVGAIISEITALAAGVGFELPLGKAFVVVRGAQ